MASQAHKREQSRVSFGTSSRTIRNSAVGPRLRNGWTLDGPCYLVSDGPGR